MTDVWSQYAAALGRMGRYQEAFEAYGRVIQLQPDEPNGPLGASSMLLALNRPDDARAHAELALTSAPSQAHQALALIEVTRKRDVEALRQAELAATVDPGLPMPAFIRGTIAYNHQRYDEALGFLLEARKGYAQRSAQPRDLHFMIGDSLARLERYAEAEPYLLEEVRLYPQHVRARAGLALLYQSMGRGPEAERALAELVRDVPSREASDTAARVWRMFGRRRPGGRGRGRGAAAALRSRRNSGLTEVTEATGSPRRHEAHEDARRTASCSTLVDGRAALRAGREERIAARRARGRDNCQRVTRSSGSDPLLTTRRPQAGDTTGCHEGRAEFRASGRGPGAPLNTTRAKRSAARRKVRALNREHLLLRASPLTSCLRGESVTFVPSVSR